MTFLCAWCQARVHRIPAVDLTHHSLCGDCRADFEQCQGIELLALVEDLPYGAIAIDSDLRVRAANQQACDLFQDTWVSLLGRPLGETFGCEHLNMLEEGPEDPICPGCALLRVVDYSFQTGLGGFTIVPGLGRKPLSSHGTPIHWISTLRVGDMVALRIDTLEAPLMLPSHDVPS